jgi:hypothetical protein
VICNPLLQYHTYTHNPLWVDENHQDPQGTAGPCQFHDEDQHQNKSQQQQREAATGSDPMLFYEQTQITLLHRKFSLQVVEVKLQVYTCSNNTSQNLVSHPSQIRKHCGNYILYATQI